MPEQSLSTTKKWFPILIVEDDDDEAQLLMRALQKSGAQNPIHIADGGREAMQYLKGEPPYSDRQRYPLPKVLFVDLRMPEITGFDVLAWLKDESECQIIPVIVLSNSTLNADVVKAYKLGANCYLHKPLDLDDMVQLMKQTLDFWGACLTPQLPPNC